MVVLPITSGDTAFRVGRLILADYFRVPQTRIVNRYILAIPLFGLSLALNFVNFDVIWRYFGWANQALAAVALWTGAAFLARRRSRWWLAFAPAVFMTVVTTSYILVEDVGFGLNPRWGTILGLVAGVASAALFLCVLPKLAREENKPPLTGATHRCGTSLGLACVLSFRCENGIAEPKQAGRSEERRPRHGGKAA